MVEGLGRVLRPMALAIGVSLLWGSGPALAESGCVGCHTDQERLEAAAAPEKAVKSAMQAGAG